MTRLSSTHAIKLLAFAGLLVAASACNDDSATVLQPRGVTYNFLMLKEGGNMPRGTMSIIRSATNTSTYELTLTGLQNLRPGAGYILWVANVVVGSPDNSIGTVSRLRYSEFYQIKVDTSISAQGDFVPKTDTQARSTTRGQVRALSAGGPGLIYIIRGDSLALNFYPHSRNLFFVTLAADTNAVPTPATDGTDARLWARYTATANATTNTAVSFGNFHATNAKQYLFIPSGRGRGSLVPDKNILIVDDSLLGRPPRGYYYETFLVKRADSTNFFAIDTISLGPQTAPAPRRSISLYGADSALVDQVVQAPSGFPQSQIIYAAATRAKGDTVPRLATSGNRFRGIANIWVTLEAKLGTAEASPNLILNGTTPPPIRLRP